MSGSAAVGVQREQEGTEPIALWGSCAGVSDFPQLGVLFHPFCFPVTGHFPGVG